jgi:hypothetical protein
MTNDFMTYERELHSFLTKNKDKTHLDFNIQETEKVTKFLDKLTKKTDQDFRNEAIDSIEDKTRISDEEYINYSIKKSKTRHEIAIQHLKDVLNFLEIKRSGINVSCIEETELLDLSNSTAVEKIIAYNELGIIEYLRNNTELGISNKGLSEALSLLSGERPETLRPSLNRLSDKDSDDKNHPYHTTKTVEKVKYSLIKLGFKLKN